MIQGDSYFSVNFLLLEKCNQIGRITNYMFWKPFHSVLKFLLLVFCSVCRWILLCGLHTAVVIILLSTCWPMIEHTCTLFILHIHLLIILNFPSMMSWNLFDRLSFLYSISRTLYFFLHASQVLPKLDTIWTCNLIQTFLHAYT